MKDDSVATEVTSRAQAFALFANDAQDCAILMLDPDGHVTSWNAGAERIKGYRAKEIIGRSFEVFYTPEDVDRGEPHRHLAEATTRGHLQYEGWRIRADGSRFWAEVVITAIFGAEHELHGYGEVTRDLTERTNAERTLKDSEERFRLFVDNVQDYAILMLDPDGCVLSWNAGAERIKGYRADEIIGRSFEVFYPPENIVRADPIRHLSEAARHGHLNYEGWRVRKDGSRFWADVVITAIFDAAQELHGFGEVTRDLTERKKAEHTLKESEERFRLLVDNVLEYAILMLDPKGGVLSWNTGAERIKGYRADEIIGRSFEVFYPPENIVRADPIRHLSEAARHGHLNYEGWRVRKNGSLFWADVVITAIFDDLDRLKGFATVTRDLTEPRKRQEELMRRAVEDPLTALPNRTLLLDRITKALSRLRRRPGRVAIFFVDLDRFKSINDTYGHHIGDTVLIVVAQRLLTAVRIEDTVARISGDEFVILCEDLDSDIRAAEIAGRFAAALKPPVVVDGEEIPVSASMGIVITDSAGAGAESLLRDADAAMYKAKADQSGQLVRFQLFDPAMREQLVDRRDSERALQKAVESNQLRLVYQPVVDLGAGCVSGFEALVRWERPQYGLVSPADFIPLAEQTGLIGPIGKWVIDEACQQMVRWDAEHPGKPFKIAVNLSARQLRANLAGDLAASFDKTGVNPVRICLELTESAIMVDAESSVRILEDVKTLGVSLAIDDFGTGYSSLSYLQRLPVDIVKIDRTFVNGVGTEANCSAIVAATIKMAQALEITVVAEGVETPQQCAHLRALDCDYAQGWHFGRPQAPNTFAIREVLSPPGAASTNTVHSCETGTRMPP